MCNARKGLFAYLRDDLSERFVQIRYICLINDANLTKIGQKTLQMSRR